MLRTQKAADCRMPATSNVSNAMYAREMKGMKILCGLTLSVEHQLKSMRCGTDVFGPVPIMPSRIWVAPMNWNAHKIQRAMIGAAISARVTFWRPNIGTGTWKKNGLITKTVERREKTSVTTENRSILDIGDLEEYKDGESNQWSVGQVCGLLGEPTASYSYYTIRWILHKFGSYFCDK